MKKVLFVATVQSHIAQFHMGAIDLLRENGYEIDVAARDNLAEKNGLALQNVNKVFNIPFDRSPFSAKNVKAYRQLKKIIDSGEYDIIHCNTPVGGILARIASRRVRQQGCCVIYTAHGFHFYDGAPRKNWLIYYPIEKIMAHFTDKLITINEEDYRLALKKFSCPTYHVHGVGIKTLKYDAVSSENAVAFRKKQGWQNDFLIVCTGELNTNKNQSTLVSAMNQVVECVPNAKLLLAGNGPSEGELRQLISKMKLGNKIILLGYRTDLEWFVHSCDLVVSASFREGLGLNIAEAMYCKKPVVASLNRGHKELVENGRTGYLVDADSTEAFAKCIIELAKNESKGRNFGKMAYKRVEKYTDKYVWNELREIYGLSKD